MMSGCTNGPADMGWSIGAPLLSGGLVSSGFSVFLVALATQLPASMEKGRLVRAVGTRGGAEGVHTPDLDFHRTENTKHKLGGKPKETCLRW